MRQQDALTLLKMGKNVFLTGPAGAGKTYVLRSYIEYLKDRGVDVAITASTGIAATHIGGMTIHSWAGIGVKDFLSERDIDYMEQQAYLWKRFEKVKVLVIDEVSMLKDSTLDMVDKVCKVFKRNNAPFGGIQVVLSGDFFQLPPIEKFSGMTQAPLLVKTETKSIQVDDDIMYELDETFEYEIKTPFAFKSRSWKEADLHICYLEEQHRQDDSILLDILNEIRTGEVSESTRERLFDQITEDDSAEITKLYTHNADVDSFNHKKLKALVSESKKYQMTSKGKVSGVDALKRGCLTPEVLEIKIGALVMFVKNNPIQGYVNGTVGEVTDFEDTFPVVETKDGRRFVAQPQSWAIEDQGNVLAEIFQVPLKLAWAVTIHKSQGMTLEQAHIDLSQAFVPGQGYVALSRLKTLDGLSLKGINQRALEVHPGVLDFDKKLRNFSDSLVRRLELTDQKRIDECVLEFLKKIGGDVDPTKRKKEAKTVSKNTYEITKENLLKKISLEDISLERKIATKTLIDHVEKLLDEKMITTKDIEYLKPKSAKDKKTYTEIKKAFEKLGVWKLKPVFEHFKEKYDYDTLRLARLFIDKTKISLDG